MENNLKDQYYKNMSIKPQMETLTFQAETFAKIITGKVGIDAFDSFVEEWKASGGDEITKEVQEELDAQQ